MVPPLEDSAPPFDMLPIVRPTTTRHHQISLIKSRGPNSRGVHMLCVGFVGIGKTYVNQAVTTIVSFPLLKAKGVDLNMSPPPQLDGLTPLSKTLHIPRPLLPTSIKLRLLNQEALIQKVLVSCMLDWLTLPRPHPFNSVSQW